MIGFQWAHPNDDGSSMGTVEGTLCLGDAIN